FISCIVRWNRRFDDQPVLALFFTPRRKHRNERRVRTHRELGDDKRSRSRNSKKIDKNRFIVECVQVGKKTESSFTRTKNFQHRPRSRELVECLVAEPFADGINKLLDARI